MSGLHRIIGRFYLGLLILCVALLGLALVAGMWSNISRSGETFQAPTGRSIVDQPLTISDVPSVTFTEQSLDPSGPSIYGSVQVILTTPQLLRDDVTGKSAMCGSNLCPRYGSARVEAIVGRIIGNEAISDAVSVGTLSALIKSGESGLAVPAEVPLVGSAARFPQDSYGALLSLGVSIDGLYFADEDKNPPEIQVVNGLHDAVEIATIRPACGTGMDLGCADYILTFTRPIPDQLYVYAVAAIPLIFALLFIHLLFLNPRYRSEPVQEFMAALVAAILAILPIRPILVPSNVIGLTRVDVVLALGLVLSVSVVMVRYITEAWRPSVGTE